MFRLVIWTVILYFISTLVVSIRKVDSPFYQNFMIHQSGEDDADSEVRQLLSYMNLALMMGLFGVPTRLENQQIGSRLRVTNDFQSLPHPKPSFSKKEEYEAVVSTEKRLEMPDTTADEEVLEKPDKLRLGHWEKMLRGGNPQNFQISLKEFRRMMAILNRRKPFHPSLDEERMLEDEQYEKLIPDRLLPEGECRPAEDGHRRMFCPTPDDKGQWRCIDDLELCDGMKDCPSGEDELVVHCLFYTAVESQIRMLAENFLNAHG